MNRRDSRDCDAWNEVHEAAGLQRSDAEGANDKTARGTERRKGEEGRARGTSERWLSLDRRDSRECDASNEVQEAADVSST